MKKNKYLNRPLKKKKKKGGIILFEFFFLIGILFEFLTNAFSNKNNIIVCFSIENKYWGPSAINWG